jgi:molybdopterin/thiamine biosynthesis adenylyltransferase
VAVRHGVGGLSHKQAKADRRAQSAAVALVPRGRALVRAGRAGDADVAARIPWMPALRGKTVAFFGLGALGAPAAIELAKAGVGYLRVMDGDYVDPATACRWPLGVGFAGLAKVQAVESFIASNWPTTALHVEHRRIGQVREVDVEPDGAALDRMLDGSDLVFDATAEMGVSYLLSDLARERQLPYVSISATHGAWGGIVLVVAPGTPRCWMCFQQAQPGSIAAPPSDPDGVTQPAGCAAITFTGSAFDLLPVVAEGVRTSVAMLGNSASNGYPGLSWDVATLALRDASGMPLPPTWKTYRLNDLEPCTRCAS